MGWFYAIRCLGWEKSDGWMDGNGVKSWVIGRYWSFGSVGIYSGSLVSIDVCLPIYLSIY